MHRPLRTHLLDSVLEVRAPPEITELLAPLLPPSDVTGPPGRIDVERLAEGYVVAGRRQRAQCHDVATVVERVLEMCNATAVEECRDFAVHAGVVHRDGRVLALPAPSGLGKTTLVASLLRTGWSYVSDEALVVTRSGDVRPYPKWLSLHRWSLDRLGLPLPAQGREERPAGAVELGDAGPVHGPLRLTDIVLPARAAGASRLVRREAAAGAVELLRMSFNHYRDPRASIELVSELARESGVWALDVGDPLEAAELLTRTVPSS